MRFNELPLDILLEQTLPSLDVESLAALSATCQLQYALCNDDRVWQRRVTCDFGLPQLPLNTERFTWKQLYIELDQAQRTYAWGENSDKRLGFGDQDSAERDVYMRQIAVPRELRTLRNKGIVNIVAGDWSFHALDRRGQVWMWGWTQSRHPRIMPLQQDLVRHPMRVLLPSQVRIKAIASGNLHAVALDHAGRLWHWTNSWKPQQVHIAQATGPITHVTAHRRYSTALSSTGQVFLVPFPDSTEPIMVVSGPPIHENKRFICVAALDHASIALTTTGQVFQLQFPSASHSAADRCTVIELKQFSRLLQPSFDPGRTSLSAQGKQFAICSHGKALLGRVNSTADDEPQILQVAGHDILKVTFGNFHYGALTSEGDLLTWGRYSSGALGRGFQDDEHTETTPEVVAKLENMFVFAMGFGGYHSACTAIPRDLLIRST